MNTLLTFDLHESGDYAKAYEILTHNGFVDRVNTTKTTNLALPSTTWLGSSSLTAVEIHDYFQTAFTTAGCRPKHVAVVKFVDHAFS